MHRRCDPPPSGVLVEAERLGDLAQARFGATAGDLVGKANPDRAVLEEIAAVMLRCLDPL